MIVSHRRFHLSTGTAFVAGLLAGSASAQTAPRFDQIVAATHPVFSVGTLTAHVLSAHSAGCQTVLTLDNGQTYTIDLSKSAVAMNKMLMIGDGDDVVGLTYQGDGARDAASAAEAAMTPMSAKCSSG